MNDLATRLTRTRFNEELVSMMCESAKQILRREPFHEFVEVPRCLLPDKTISLDPKRDWQVIMLHIRDKRAMN